MLINPDHIWIAEHLIEKEKKDAVYTIRFLQYYHGVELEMAREIISRVCTGYDLAPDNRLGEIYPEHDGHRLNVGDNITIMF